jgi:hypothetical protein
MMQGFDVPERWDRTLSELEKAFGKWELQPMTGSCICTHARQPLVRHRFFTMKNILYQNDDNDGCQISERWDYFHS